MNRIPAFLFVGSFLSSLMFILVFSPSPVFTTLAEQGWHNFFYTLLFCVGMLLLPMLALAGIDYKLSPYRWRVPLCGLAGFVLAVGLVYCFALESGTEDTFEKFRKNWFLIGLSVGFPAAVSSWLTERPRTTRLGNG